MDGRVTVIGFFVSFFVFAWFQPGSKSEHRSKLAPRDSPLFDFCGYLPLGALLEPLNFMLSRPATRGVYMSPDGLLDFPRYLNPYQQLSAIRHQNLSLLYYALFHVCEGGGDRAGAR